MIGFDEFDDWYEEPEVEEEEPTRFQVENAGAWWENQIPANIEEVRKIDRFLKTLRDKREH